MKPEIGAIQICDAAEYGEVGFVIEEYSTWNGGEPTWAVPDWTERGLSHLDGTFPTRRAAEAALGSI
jgi:hypothetical protein